MNDDQITKGKIHLIHRDKDGNIKREWDVYNLATSAGKAAEAGLVFNVGGITAFGYLAVGSSNTAPAVGQTALQAEISTNGLSRLLVTPTRITTTVTNDTAQMIGVWNVSGSSTVEEIGIFNASSNGIMLSRALTSSTSLVNGDQLQVTYTFQYL